MLHASFPQLFSCSVIVQFKTNRGFNSFELPRSNFNVKIVALVRDFQDFRPGEAIYSQPGIEI